MVFTISGKHIDITDAMRSHAEEKVSKLPKHFEDINEIEMVIDDHPNNNISVEVIVRARHNKTFVITEISDDAYKSIDTAVHKMERQLRKSKEKQLDNQHRSGQIETDEI